MRPYTLLVALLLCWPTTSRADDLHDGVDFGIQGFLATSWMDLHGNDLAQRPFIGLGIGAAVRAGLGSRLSIESGLAYRLRGDRVEYRQYSFSPQILESYLPSEVRINALSLPILLNAHFTSGEAELRVAGGMEIAMNISGRFEEGRDAPNGTGPTYDQTLISVFNRFDVGPTIELGLSTTQCGAPPSESTFVDTTA